MLAVEDATTAETLRAWYQPSSTSSCRLSLIATPHGELTGPDGTSQSLSNPVDRAILLAQRHHADAVITGAATVRTEPVPIPRHAPLVLLSRTGDLSGHRVTEASYRDDSVVVITGQNPAADPSRFFPSGVARHVALGEVDLVDASELTRFLRASGYNHLLVEGGRQLATLFAQAHLFDELCVSLTAAPRSENHPPLPWWEPGWGTWTATHVLTDDQRTLYFRYVRDSVETAR